MNLDAMIARADFASIEEGAHYEQIANVAVRDLVPGAMLGPMLRKPDFQRETNHWTPEQVVALLECFTQAELIPSVILWRSPSHIFVIDGGHRLSVLRAWIEDDYGDGSVSHRFFQGAISNEQKKVAEHCRQLIRSRVGAFRDYDPHRIGEGTPEQERHRIATVSSRALPIQWVSGDANKAESSFFRINTKGTPLDEIEELLLRNRRRPAAIAARAVIRAGKGHRYWSGFDAPKATAVEAAAAELHSALFEPELKRPVKTLDLPLGGSKSIRAALEVLLDFMLIACRDQQGRPSKLSDQPEDETGDLTVEALKRARKLASRMTGNDQGSLGLHPAIYFYGPTARHSSPMFMGTVSLIAKKMRNNDGAWFRRFSAVRSRVESALMQHKDLIATILQKSSSGGRDARFETILGEIVAGLEADKVIDEQYIIDSSGLSGKVLTAVEAQVGEGFSDSAKSVAFLQEALKSAVRCSICEGFIDPEKSMSYDHIERVREGGMGGAANCQLTHPYCNQSVKQ